MNRRRLTVVSDGCDAEAAAAAGAVEAAAAATATTPGSNNIPVREGKTRDNRSCVVGIKAKAGPSGRVEGRGGHNSSSSGGSGTTEGGRRGVTVDRRRGGGSSTGGGPGARGSGGELCEAEVGETQRDDNTIACVVSSYAGFSKKGYAPYNPRKQNQDAVIMAEDTSTASLFLAVLDGHGEVGEKVAQAFRVGLVEAVFEHPDWSTSPETAVAESISTIERALLADPDVDTSFSGTTLVSVCVRGTKLVLTNVGDSRATLGRRHTVMGEGGEQQGKTGCSLIAQALTVDHKPDIPEEKERILDAGGRVFALEYSDGVDGPPRVWLGDVNVPGLAMSRTLGDVVAHTVGVTSYPDTYRCDLNDQGEGSQDSTGDGREAALLILATDGLWEFVSDQEAVDIASQCSEPREAVQKLIYEATNRWMKEEQVVDDITVCVAFLHDWMGEDTG
ncbi:unnamed protein product [Pylaiella littoralis]